MRIADVLIESNVPYLSSRLENELLVMVPVWEDGDEYLQSEYQRWRLHPEFDGESFDQWLPGWIVNRAENFLRLIDAKFVGGRLPVYRAISAPRDWQPEGHPGIYWSWDRDAAQAHQGKFHGTDHVEWLLEASVDTHSIEWSTTILLNVAPTSASEKEIRVHENPIEVTRFYQRR